MLIAEWVGHTALASGIWVSHLSGQCLPSAGEAHTEVAPLGAQNQNLLRWPLTSHVSLQRYLALVRALHLWMAMRIVHWGGSQNIPQTLAIQSIVVGTTLTTLHPP